MYVFATVHVCKYVMKRMCTYTCIHEGMQRITRLLAFIVSLLSYFLLACLRPTPNCRNKHHQSPFHCSALSRCSPHFATDVCLLQWPLQYNAAHSLLVLFRSIATRSWMQQQMLNSTRCRESNLWQHQASGKLDVLIWKNIEAHRGSSKFHDSSALHFTTSCRINMRLVVKTMAPFGS